MEIKRGNRYLSELENEALRGKRYDRSIYGYSKYLRDRKYQPSTVVYYTRAVESIIENENITFFHLLDDIDKFVRDYGLYGKKSHYGAIGHGTWRNALNRLQEFVELLKITENYKQNKPNPDLVNKPKITKIYKQNLDLSRPDPETLKIKLRMSKIGSLVTVYFYNNQKEKTFKLVDSLNSDGPENCISVSSPIGKALLHKNENDEITVDTPRGRIDIKILRIDNKGCYKHLKS